MGKFHNYSLENAILIGFQKPDATHVAGFRTWKRLGRYVKKGEHGIAIMAPITYRKKKPEESDNREPEDEEVRTFKTVHVFDISQTDGKPLPEFAHVNGDPGVYIERLRQYVTNKGIVLEYTDLIGSAEGVSAGGLIKLKRGLTPAEELSVLAHEAAHEILHSDKDKRPRDKKIRETEAEAVAFVVCHGIGLDVNSASSDYIQLYSGDKKTLMESLERIQRTAAEILGAVMDKESDCKTEGGETCVAAAA
jgi:antirestriction protein ArdC